MDFPELNKKKLYYSIGEVAKYFDVNASLIRFWEGEFDLIKPKKNNKGNRMFTMKDIENFKKIYTLVKINGFTLDGAKKALKSKDLEASLSNKSQTVETKLMAIRNQLVSLKNSL